MARRKYKRGHMQSTSRSSQQINGDIEALLMMRYQDCHTARVEKFRALTAERGFNPNMFVTQFDELVPLLIMLCKVVYYDLLEILLDNPLLVIVTTRDARRRTIAHILAAGGLGAANLETRMRIMRKVFARLEPPSLSKFLNAKEIVDFTPLDYACTSESPEMALLYMANGAKRCFEDKVQLYAGSILDHITFIQPRLCILEVLYAAEVSRANKKPYFSFDFIRRVCVETVGWVPLGRWGKSNPAYV